LRERASEILWRKHQMKLSGNPSYVEKSKNLTDDLAEDLCDQIELLHFKIQYRREKNET
jgi:hypothetical protein